MELCSCLSILVRALQLPSQVKQSPEVIPLAEWTDGWMPGFRILAAIPLLRGQGLGFSMTASMALSEGYVRLHSPDKAKGPAWGWLVQSQGN